MSNELSFARAAAGGGGGELKLRIKPTTQIKKGQIGDSRGICPFLVSSSNCRQVSGGGISFRRGPGKEEEVVKLYFRRS